MSRHLTVVPAYGRDYKSKRAAMADWDANKNFIIADAFDRYDGQPVNKEQLPASTTVNIRYAKLRRIATARGGAQ